MQVALADTRIPLVEVAQGDGDGEAELELDDDPAHATRLDAGRVPVVVTVSQARMQLGHLSDLSWMCCFHTSPVANTISASYGRRGQATLTEQGVGSAPGRRQGAYSANFQVAVSLVRADGRLYGLVLTQSRLHAFLRIPSMMKQG